VDCSVAWLGKQLKIAALLANKIAARDFCVKTDATPANARQCARQTGGSILG
jgi:hypothetical protein